MSQPTAVERAQLRAQVASAGQVLFSTWPVKTFVAVNPLGGVQHRPFEEAVELVGGLLGLRGHLPLGQFRALHAEGRINDADLDAALRRRLPELDALAPIELDSGGSVSALQALRADLVHAPAAASSMRPRGAGEWCDQLLGTRIAPLVDEQVAKWCAAFLDTAQARWAMPGRDLGLYRAWRELVPADPTLRRLKLARRCFQDLPERPEDAILAALAILRVPEADVAESSAPSSRACPVGPALSSGAPSIPIRLRIPLTWSICWPSA